MTRTVAIQLGVEFGVDDFGSGVAIGWREDGEFVVVYAGEPVALGWLQATP